MTAATIDGYALAAIVAALVAVVILAAFALRMLRDHGYRIARIGVFVERERVTDDEKPTDEQPTREWPRDR